MQVDARIIFVVLATALAAVSCERAEPPPAAPQSAVPAPPAASLPAEPRLSPIERAAKDRAECQLIATRLTGFDPVLAEEPPRTLSETHQRGGDVVGSGAVLKGAAKGALVGVAGGAVAGEAGKGAAAGAVGGALIGGVRRHKQTKELVTTTRTNPEYTAYVDAKKAFRAAFDDCMRVRAAEAAKEQQ
jgi:hypothetical protein